MAVKEVVIIEFDIDGAQKLTKLQRAFDSTGKSLKALNKAEKDGLVTAAQASKQRSRLATQHEANRNALNDHRGAILKNNNALKKNSGFVSGVRKGIGQWSSSLIGLAAGIAVVTKLVTSSVKIFKDFEKTNSKLKAVTKSTTEEMKLMTDQSKELGSTTAFTATEVAELQIEFAKLGFPTDEILEMTEATLNGAAALGSELGEQASLTGATLKQYAKDSSEATKVNDVFAESAASSALDFQKLNTALPIVGATANAVGVSFERTTAILGTLSDRGLDASTSGTSLRNVFLELEKKGLSFEEAMSKVNNSTNKAKTSMELFGKRGATTGLILAESGESIEALEAKLLGADGAAKEMADTMLNNLSGDITKASSAWEGFILSLEDGTGVIGNALRGIVQFGTGALNELQNLDLFFKGTFQSLGDFSEEQINRTIRSTDVWATENGVSLNKIAKSFDEIPFDKLSGNIDEVKEKWVELLGGDRQDAVILFNGYIKDRVSAEESLKKSIEDRGVTQTKVDETTIKLSEKETKARKDKANQAVKDAINQNKEELSLFIAQQGVKAKTLQEELVLAEQLSIKKQSILQSELDAKLISQTKFETDSLTIKQEFLDVQTALTIDNANRELQSIVESNQSKIEAGQFLNDELFLQEQTLLENKAQARRDFLATELDEGIISRTEYNDAINLVNEENDIAKEELNLEKKEAEAEQKIVDLELQREIDTLNREDEFKLRQQDLDRQRDQELNVAEKTGADTKLIEDKYSLLSKKIDKDKFDSRVQIASQSFGSLADLAGRESAAGKAFAIAQTTISTFQGATAAFTGMTTSIPGPVGIALGVVAAAGAVASGIANVNKIKNTKAPKAARGMSTVLGGDKHSAPSGGVEISADGVPVLMAERGERLTVVNAKNTELFNTLSDWNAYGGNGDPFSGGSVSYAARGGVSTLNDGGISLSSVSSQRGATESSINNLANEIQNSTIVVSVQDINDIQSDVQRVEVKAIV